MLKINKIILIVSLFAISFSVIAQKQVITFAPLGFWNKLRVKYEKPLNDNLSAGIYLNAYYAVFKGVRLDPFVRLYPGGKAPKGFYLQGKLVAGYFNSKIEYEYEQITPTDTVTLEEYQWKSFPTFGGGLGLGYQFLIGKSEFPIDLYLGFQYSKFTAPTSVVVNNIKYETLDDALWYFTGPGSFLNMNFGIGFSF